MCGIAGFMSESRRDADAMTAIATSMTSKIVYRGPDDAGVWVDPAAGVALGFRRLAIVDLTPLGHQPMFSEEQRYGITFNGEIYNFLDLRAELESRGHRFRGHSDTEVLLAGFMEWGVEEALRRANGMFAFAVWDRVDRRLWLARDRIGKKPLYYGICGRSLVWGSELKALVAHPDFNQPIDRSSMASYLQLGYVPAPFSIYTGIHKLPAGTTVSFRAGELHLPQPSPYWSATEAAASAQVHEFTGAETDAIEKLDQLLRDATRIRMIADVPLGAFLSGGIDSSLVVSLMQAQSARPVKTYSIGFAQSEFDEAPHAKAIAKHLGTDHTELYVSPEEALAVVPRLPDIYDEPFADSSQIPTYLVSRLARTEVTVALSGDGGDELFGGYDRYALTKSIWRAIGWMPRFVRPSAASLLRSRAVATTVARVLPVTDAADKFQKLGDVLSSGDEAGLYARVISAWKNPDEVALGSTWRSSIADVFRRVPVRSLLDRMMVTDAVTYLPDDILVKVDRASMAVSLECRAPLLDYRVYEFAWRLPRSMKIRGRDGKWILRRLLQRYVPRDLFERPKMGFGVPLAKWLRGPLREWASSLLDERRLRAHGYFATEPILAKWREHQSGARNWHYYLWPILMFEAWLDRSHEQRIEARNPQPPDIAAVHVAAR